ncbi:MAG: hypothetical protein KC431_04935 [Myxococcales bacterium]|nr:hypothetical protein [Myxococcales bacterium]
MRISLASLVVCSCLCSLVACSDDGSSDDGGTSSTGEDEIDGSSGTDTDASTDSSTDTGTDSDTTGEPELGCNGHVELCDRPYDQVVFPGTHNAHSASSEGFSVAAANQLNNIPTQLADGIRVMLMDTYEDPDNPGTVLLCHGSCNFGSSVHAEVLGEIVAFLEANPNEILTIIYEDHVDVSLLIPDFESTGAIDLVYAHPVGEPWPTLGEMAAADTRLVITAEQGSPPPEWYQHVWDLAWDTPYGFTDFDQFSCALNRGSSDNDLFLVNHWVSNQFGLPSAANADTANAYDLLLGRAQECWAMWDHPTNFIAVDFYDRGDLFAVVDTLNGF